jgi:hypothetical protein
MRPEQIKIELANLLKALEGGADLSFLRQRQETLTALRLAIGSVPKTTSARVGMRSWKPEEEERLVVEFDGGKPVQELAEEFNRSPSSIVARLQKLGRSLEF